MDFLVNFFSGGGFVTFVVFLLILWILVLIHEFGHYWAAKKSGVYVEEFGLGLPPRVWGFRIGETLYSFNWLPFGGFVKLYGEDAESDKEYEVDGKKVSKKRAFYNQKPINKLVIILAGVFMNFVLGVMAFALSFSLEGIPEVTNRVQILNVVEGGPAEIAGFRAGDIVSCVGTNNVCEKVSDVGMFVSYLNNNKGSEVNVELLRGEDLIRTIVIPRVDHPQDEGATGISVGVEIVQRFYSWWQMPFRGMYEGLKEATFWGVTIVKMLGELVLKLFGGVVPTDVAGPVGIYSLTGKVVEYGFLAVVRFMGILSINLAIMNILPLPALDGGRLWFVIYEMITRKRVNAKVERWVNTAGMLFLLGLIGLVTLVDIRRLIMGTGLF